MYRRLTRGALAAAGGDGAASGIGLMGVVVPIHGHGLFIQPYYDLNNLHSSALQPPRLRR
eukprot:SAG11_NODE_552_length_8583_cov_3.699081_7_plen_60_part_00